MPVLKSFWRYNLMKIYKAIVWVKESDKSGQRVSVTATSLNEAKEQLALKYGEGNIFDLHNEGDAARVR